MYKPDFRLMIAALPFVAGCLDYSSYQDARIVERGTSQGTIAVSANKDSFDHESEDFDWFVVDAFPRWGLGSRFDAGFRMSVIFTEGSLGHVVLGGDVRFGVIPNYLAVTLPVTTALGSYAFATTNLQPGVVLTLPLADQIDLNGSVRRSFYLHEDFEPFRWWLYNAGLGIVVAPGWRLRPEFGWMVSDDSTDRTVYMQFGVGITRQVAE